MKNFLKTIRRTIERSIAQLKPRQTASRIPGAHALQSFANRYTFPFAIGTAIFVGLLLTVFSVFLYSVTGTSKLDLSRPGYEAVREQVKTANSDERSFDQTGELDQKTIQSFLDEYKKHAQNLSQYDAFDPKILDDTQLGLNSTTQVTPSDGANP